MDAVIAGLLVSCTSEAMLCSIGGGGFFVVHQESEQREVVIDAMSRMPSRSRASDLHRIEVDFGETTQPFWIGAGWYLRMYSFFSPGVVLSLIFFALLSSFCGFFFFFFFFALSLELFRTL
jgi:Gamma-glutamyltranspeptidase